MENTNTDNGRIEAFLEALLEGQNRANGYLAMMCDDFHTVCLHLIGEDALDKPWIRLPKAKGRQVKMVYELLCEISELELAQAVSIAFDKLKEFKGGYKTKRDLYQYCHRKDMGKKE